MKRIYILVIVALGLVVSISSCDDGDAVIDDVFDNTTRGAILRTVNVSPDTLIVGDQNANFSVDLEMQDIEGGDLVENIEVFLAFDDAMAGAGGEMDKAEVQVTTLEKASFTTGPFGLPRTSYSITLPEMAAAVAIDEANIAPGDTFTIRFELVLTDGRRFSQADNSGTITGSFFNSPFQYALEIVAP